MNDAEQKERKYRLLHSYLCMVVVLEANIVAFLAGTGPLYHASLVCLYVVIALQWSVIVRGQRRDKRRKLKHEINEFDELLKYDNDQWKTFTFMFPAKREWYKRWYDKWKGITYVYLWEYGFDLDDKKHNFKSETKFAVTEKQMFTMKLKGFLNLTKVEDAIPALEYLGQEELFVKAEA